MLYSIINEDEIEKDVDTFLTLPRCISNMLIFISRDQAFNFIAIN